MAIYAQNLTLDQVRDGIAAAAHCTAGTVAELIEALADRPQVLTVLIDALDEAADPDLLTRKLLRPLIGHARPHRRLLLGTRWPGGEPIPHRWTWPVLVFAHACTWLVGNERDDEQRALMETLHATALRAGRQRGFLSTATLVTARLLAERSVPQRVGPLHRELLEIGQLERYSTQGYDDSLLQSVRQAMPDAYLFDMMFRDDVPLVLDDYPALVQEARSITVPDELNPGEDPLRNARHCYALGVTAYQLGDWMKSGGLSPGSAPPRTTACSPTSPTPSERATSTSSHTATPTSPAPRSPTASPTTTRCGPNSVSTPDQGGAAHVGASGSAAEHHIA